VQRSCVLKLTMTCRWKSGQRRYQGTFVVARRRSGRPGRRSAGSSLPKGKVEAANIQVGPSAQVYEWVYAGLPGLLSLQAHLPWVSQGQHSDIGNDKHLASEFYDHMLQEPAEMLLTRADGSTVVVSDVGIVRHRPLGVCLACV